MQNTVTIYVRSKLKTQRVQTWVSKEEKISEGETWSGPNMWMKLQSEWKEVRKRWTYIEDERFVGRVEREATPEVYAPNQNHENGRNC